MYQYLLIYITIMLDLLQNSKLNFKGELDDLDEQKILKNLKNRYETNTIYVIIHFIRLFGWLIELN